MMDEQTVGGETHHIAGGNTVREKIGVTFPQGGALFTLFKDLEYDDELRRCNRISLPSSWFGWLTSVSTFLLVFLTLVGATHGLAFLGFKVTKDTLDIGEIVFLILCILFFFYVEGVVGFMKSWSPVTARRCLLVGTILSKDHLVKSLIIVLLAPIFACGFFWAPRRRILISYSLVVAIFLLIVAVKQMRSPWHEIVDCGVAVGLGTGTLSFLYFYVKAIVNKQLPPDIDHMNTSRTGDASAPLLS